MMLAAPPIVRLSSLMPLTIITRKIVPSPMVSGEFDVWVTELRDTLRLATDALDAHRLDDVIYHLRASRNVQLKINHALKDARAQ
jgi:hypothetical protein